MSINLIWKHQRETYKKMIEQLKKTHRVGYTYPTGCGKTFPALKLLEDKLGENPNARVMILAPSNAILKQMSEYIEKYIANDKDLPSEKIFNNVILSTYQNLNYRYMEYLKMDVIIGDEWHRVGAEGWGKALDTLLENNPEADIIGMTATPERTDKTNMLDEYFEGENTVYELSLTDALSGDKTGEVVLNPSRYVRVLSELKPVLKEYKEKIDNIHDGDEKTKLLKKFEKFEETISVADNLKDTFTKNMTKKDGKYLVFCKDKADMLEAMSKAQEWFGDVNQDMWIDYLYSGTKTDKQNDDTLEEFRKPALENEGKLKLLFCIDKVNEGVHIPGLSGAIELRPTESPVLYTQHIGRILTADKNAEETVFIDVANNWIRFREHYEHFVEGIERGQRKQTEAGIREDFITAYESYKYTADELELLDLFREIDEKCNNSKIMFDKYIKWVEKHKNEETDEFVYPRQVIGRDAKQLLVPEMTVEEYEETKLGKWWKRNPEQRMIIDEYAGVEIKDIPKEYREIVQRGRNVGLGLEKQQEKIDITFDMYIEWIKANKNIRTGQYQKPRGTIRRDGIAIPKSELTENEIKEYELGRWWERKSKEKIIIEKYKGKQIDEIPEEYRKIIETGRSVDLGITEFEKFIKFIKEHKNKKTGEYRKPRIVFSENNKKINVEEMTPEQYEEHLLGAYWGRNPIERIILEKYIDYPIEKIPKDDRAIVQIGRSVGLGIKEKSKFEQFIEFMEIHKNNETGEYKLPRSKIEKKEESDEDKVEVRLGKWWSRNPKERKVLEEYKDIDIEKVPEQYRKIIELGRSVGLGSEQEPLKLRQIKEIKEWMIENDWKKSPKQNSNIEKEKRLAGAWNEIQTVLKKYSLLKTKEEKDKYLESYPRLDEVQEIYQEIVDKKVPFYIKNIDEINDWIELNGGDKRPSTLSKDENERSLGDKYRYIKKIVDGYVNIETEDEKSKYEELYPDIEILIEKFEEIGRKTWKLPTNLRIIREVKTWKETNGKIPSYCSQNEDEKKIASNYVRS